MTLYQLVSKWRLWFVSKWHTILNNKLNISTLMNFTPGHLLPGPLLLHRRSESRLGPLLPHHAAQQPLLGGEPVRDGRVRPCHQVLWLCLFVFGEYGADCGCARLYGCVCAGAAGGVEGREYAAANCQVFDWQECQLSEGRPTVGAWVVGLVLFFVWVRRGFHFGKGFGKKFQNLFSSPVRSRKKNSEKIRE